MKTLFLIRHAKSSWDDPSLNDFDRPLNERGKKDAHFMAKRLTDKKIRIDAFVSSPARRARKTAEFFSKEFGGEEDKIILRSELYAAPPHAFEDVVSKLPNNLDHVALFSHNPGITEFANTLTKTKVDDMPTCSIFAVRITIDKWNEFEKAKKEFWFFDYPKAASV
jgi:phosphohistidine phosphatase